MRKFSIITILLSLGLLLAGQACSGNKSQATDEPQVNTTEPVNDKAIDWLTWDEAIARNGKNPKKIFIDVYTDWCGWCKKMDATTFQDKGIIQYINTHFHPVKMDGEMKEDVLYNGHTFKFVNSGRRGYHELAASLLDNRMGYPSMVAMDEEVNRITIIPGYRDAEGIMPILTFLAEEKYKAMDFQQYEQSLKGE